MNKSASLHRKRNCLCVACCEKKRLKDIQRLKFVEKTLRKYKREKLDLEEALQVGRYDEIYIPYDPQTTMAEKSRLMGELIDEGWMYEGACRIKLNPYRDEFQCFWILLKGGN